MQKLPLPTRSEAIALQDERKAFREMPIEKIVFYDCLILDLLRADPGILPDLDVGLILRQLNLHWFEIRTQAWTLRIEPVISGDECSAVHLYQLIWREAGQEPVMETMDIESLYRLGVPLVKAQGIAILHRKDFISWEYHAGQVHLRLQPGTHRPTREQENGQLPTLDPSRTVDIPPHIQDYIQLLIERGERLQREAEAGRENASDL